MQRFLIKTFLALALLIGAGAASPLAHAATPAADCFAQHPTGYIYDDTLGCVPETTPGTSAMSECLAKAGYAWDTQLGCIPETTATVSPESTCFEQHPTGYVYDDLLGCVPSDTPSAVQHVQTDSSGAADTAAAPSTSGTNVPTDLKLGTDTDSMLTKVMLWIMSLFAWLLAVAALTLDYAVFYTVMSMGSFIHGLSAVGVTWRILRDIGNIFIIFGFLFIGISIILGNEHFGYGKKMLPMLLVAAVFLNFSLFISEAIVDTGNLFATQFYTQINNGKQPTSLSLEALSTSNEGISNKIMSQLGLATVYGNAKNNSLALQASNSLIIAFMGIILFLIAAFVMFSLAFILIARFVWLLFLIIFSPIGFAGWAVPQLSSLSKQWWDELVSQTITAPVLFLSLYIALAVITDVHFLTGFGGSEATWDGFVAGKNLPGFASLILSFSVAMGLLMAVVIISKKMGAVGSSWATKTAGKVTFGLTAWGANRTLGRGAYYAQRRLRQSAGFNKLDAFTGRLASRALDKAATGSFDVRGTTSFKNIPFGGIEAGDPAKDGFIGARKRNIEDHEKAVKAIETAHKDGFNEEDKATMIKAAQVTAKENLENVTKSHGVISQEVEQKGATVKQFEQEVAKLEAEESQRKMFNVQSTPEDEKKLASARTNLETSKAELEKRNAELEKSSENLTKATETLKNINSDKDTKEKAVADAKKKNLEDSKLAYVAGAGLNQPLLSLLNPFALAAYGPDGSAAAKKIKESFKKKDTAQQIKDLLKHELEEDEKKRHAEEGDGKGDGKDKGAGHAGAAPAKKETKPAQHDDHGHSH